MQNLNNLLPPDFDGVFRFTNATSEDFTAKWGNVAYTFPAQKTTPMIIPGATPEEVQHIRKKFAKELAIREFYKSPRFLKLNDTPMGGTAATYTEDELTRFIQTCLEPLPIAQATVEVLPKDSESRYRKDNKGRNVTKVLDPGESLMENSGESI